MTSIAVQQLLSGDGEGGSSDGGLGASDPEHRRSRNIWPRSGAADDRPSDGSSARCGRVWADDGPGVSRIRLRCQLLAQGGFMDFARRRAWELCRRSKSEPDRNFVTCQPLAAEGDDRTGIGCCAGSQFYRSCHDLSFCLIRYPHDISLHDVRVLQEDLLDFERRDIDATGLDHLLQPSAETDAAVWVNGSKIAGQKVSVAVKRFGIELRCVEIAWHDATADGELPDLARRQRVPRD